MTEKQRERLEARNRKYAGFGDERSAAHWARIADVPLTSFHRYLKQGLTVEDIFALRGATYTPENQDTRQRVRWGARMLEAREMLREIIARSGYVTHEDDAIGVQTLRKTQLRITYHGRPLGVYDYKADVLTLPRETIKLRDPLVPREEIKILKNAHGDWELHPHTRLAIAKTTIFKE